MNTPNNDTLHTLGVHTEADLVALVSKASPTEAELLKAIASGGPEGLTGRELRRRLGGACANPSASARSLNAKLSRLGLPYRLDVEVERRGKAGSAAHWRLLTNLHAEV